jgi:putative hydrolases of HD superfamily
MNLKSIQPSLRFTEETEPIWLALEAIPRTGWVQWDIPNPENVAEHILATRELAVSLKVEFDLTEEEFADLLAIIEVHDWPEIITGDIVVIGDEVNAIQLSQTKKEQERIAMEDICRTLVIGSEALSFYTRYEKGEDKVAKYAKELDKLQAFLLAVQYHKQYNRPGMVEEFYEYTKVRLTTPLLLEILKSVMK